MDHVGLLAPASGQMQAYHGLDLLESLPACRTRVQEKHVAERFHTFYLQNVAVTANKDIWRILRQARTHPALPATRPTGNMRHPEPHARNVELIMLGIRVPDIPPIYVAPDGSYGRHSRQLIQQSDMTDVSGVKDQIDVLQIVEKTRMKPPVRV